MEYKDICEQPQQNARIAHIDDPSYIEIDSNGQMIEYPVEPVTGVSTRIPWDYEILASFFQYYHITPIWIDCNGTLGILDEETGNWTGALGKVDKYN